MRTRCILAALASALFASVPAASSHAQTIRLGVIGDSLSDEYAEESYDYAFNWLEQLVLFRGIDAGPTAIGAGQPGGTWGEPRRTGHRLNWSRYGADSAAMISQGQHLGLAGGASEASLTHAVLMIGANDFRPIPLPGFAYFNIYWGLWSSAQRQNYVNTIAGRIALALDTLLETETRVILATVPDYGVTPIARAFFTNPQRRQNVTAVIASLNGTLAALAESREIVLVEVAALSTAIFGTNFDINASVPIGGVPILLDASDTAGNTNPAAGFVDDGIHPHTTLQGLFANLMLVAIGVGSADPPPLFSETELLGHAGLEHTGTDTVEGWLGAWASYVVDFTPPIGPIGDLDGDGFVDGADLAILLGQWGGCPPKSACSADLDGDGSVGGADLAILLGNWGSGG